MSQNPYVQEFRKAAKYLGLPLSWATNISLINLVKRESEWKKNAKNLSSLAFGLFQFLPRTWEIYLKEVPYGTTDPYWQAVGGMRYIKSIYGTPDRAWKFWKATVEQNHLLAPVDLQNKARQWIGKGIKGY